jgi:CHAT domain-containing protein/tetratricopeptide (TPR) repeat protein
MNIRTPLKRAKCVVVCLFAAFAQYAGSNNNSSASSHNLGVGVATSDLISAGETRTYTLTLAAGDHAHLEIKKGDLQLQVSVCREKNQSCREVIDRHYGMLDLSFSADLNANYTVAITSVEKEKGERPYEIYLSEIVKTTRKHRLADQARMALAEAAQFRERQDQSSQLAAVAKYKEASRLWQSADDFSKAVETICSTGDVYFVLSQYPEALAQYESALSLSRLHGDQIGTFAAMNAIAYVNVYLGKNDEARSDTTKILDDIARIKTSGDFRRAEAQARNTIGEIDYAQGELRNSIEAFERAYSLYTEIGERAGQALALLNLGYSTSDLGDAQKASEYFERALTQFQAVSNMLGATLAQTALGGFYSLSGEEDKALSLHQAARAYFKRMANRQAEAAALNGIGRAYQDLNDYDSAFDYYNKALLLNQSIGQSSNIALSKFLVARVLYQKGDTEQARKFYDESLDLSRAAGDAVTEAHALKGLGILYFAKGDSTRAIEQYNAALQIYCMIGNRRSEAYVLNDIAHIQTLSGNASEAIANLQVALPLMRATGDRHGKALTLFNTAKAEKTRGDLNAALSSIKESIAIGESVRAKTTNSQLRTSYFASVEEQFELYIDILMSLHAGYPDKGYAEAALLASEQGRSRSLLDSLLAEKLTSHDDSAPDLMVQVQKILQQLDDKAEYQTRLLGRKHTQEEVDKLSQEIRELTLQYQGLRSNLSAKNPRRATLIRPDDLKAEDLQNLLKGDNALLLEFALGDDRSYLWAVTGSEIAGYELPGRAKIEEIAQKAYESITARESIDEHLPVQEQEKISNEADAAYRQNAAVLSNLLLGPVASKLSAKQIIIVGDGLLRFIPFDALPLPSQDAQTGNELLSAHNIVTLPSALTLVALRSERNVPTRNKTIEVVADPVFEIDDPRITSAQGDSKVNDQNAYFSSAWRDFNQKRPATQVSRLPSTLREAKVISELVPSNEVVTATGFDATKKKFMTGDVGSHRIVHIATHGLLNVEHPNLSGLIFSLLDPQGNSVDGFLRLHDVYNLDLQADLVVLSACRTGLGRNVGGEGVASLSSGFMYAGAKTVISSLWKVDDDTTAEFMGHFYRSLLKDQQPPAVALRNAKLEMRKDQRWRAPFYWAGFVLQGEYQNQPPAQNTTSVSWILIIIGAVFMGMGSIYAIARYK